MNAYQPHTIHRGIHRRVEADFHYVGMGEVRVGSRGELLQATLGSCVGIALLWEKGGRCGLAHCLLPAAPGPMIRIGARYVSQGVRSLVAMLGAAPADYPDVKVIIAGGARMLRTRAGVPNVGELNAQAALRHLAECGLRVSHIDVGGRRPRQLLIDCADQRFVINPIERPFEGIDHDCY